MKTAMILAAGRGERLKPLTDTIPKALCTIGHIPLIEYHVKHLAQCGFEHIVINHAYLGGQIRHHLKNGKRFGVQITYSPEPPGGLETGGGIVNALPLLGQEPFLTVNADIYTHYDFSSLVLPKDSLAHLVLVEKSIHHLSADFGLSETQHIQNNPKHYIFSGIACYRPEFFQQCQPGRYSLTPLLRTQADYQKVTGEKYNGIWFDIGSPERLRLAEEYVAKT